MGHTRVREPMAFSVNEFGASGDGETDTTRALQAAIDACGRAGGGAVVVPPGGYVTGSLWMRSNVNLRLERGATLLGSRRVDDFPICASEWEGPGVKAGRAALVCGEGLQNVSITGEGTIDGRGRMWWDSQLREPGKIRRPLLVRLVNSRNVRVEGVTLRDAAMWTLSPLACDDVVVRNVTITSPPDSPNTDGINPDSCRRVRIEGCAIDVGDDCITIKSGKEDDGRRVLRACEDVTVTNCTLRHGHGGVVIGSEVSGGIRNVSVRDCAFVGTDRGIRIKARRGRGGVVEDVSFSGLKMEGVLTPLVINMFYGCGAWGEAKVTDERVFPVNGETPRFRRINIGHVTARGAKYAAAYILGLPEMPVEDVTISDVALHLDPDNTQAGQPAMAPICGEHCRAGIIARHTRRLTLNNVSVHGQIGPAVDVTDSV